MSKRRSTFEDPTAQRAIRENQVLQSVLESLPATERAVIEARFGLLDGIPKTYDEVGRSHSVSRVRIRQIESKVMAKLRHPSRSRALGVSDDRGSVYDVIDVKGTLKILSDDQIGIVQCGLCHRRFLPDSTGRPRKYCSGKCRQAAYRVRKARDSGRSGGVGS